VLIKDKRIKELGNMSEIGRLLKILLRELNINGLVLVTTETSLNQSHFYRDHEKAHTPVLLQDIESISIYFRQNVRKSLAGLMPEEMKIIADRYDWGGLVPIYYKSRYFGFLAVLKGFDVKKLVILEGLAGRIGLIIENEALTESAIKNESFKKEFNLARQIEKFLLVKEVVDTDNYLVSADQNILDRDGVGLSFPVLFEKSIVFTKAASPYFIFCRISKSNRRMRTMRLFMIAGYFLTHSKNCKNLRELYDLLNESLFTNGSEFSIDGFLIQKTSTINWRICYFGKNVQIKCDEKDMDVKNQPSLGKAKKGAFDYIDLKNKNEIVLCINQIPSINILKKNLIK
jgi:hypothetical protein